VIYKKLQDLEEFEDPLGRNLRFFEELAGFCEELKAEVRDFFNKNSFDQTVKN